MWAARGADASVSASAARTWCWHAYREANQIIGVAFLQRAEAGEAEVAPRCLDWITAAAIAKEISAHRFASEIASAASFWLVDFELLLIDVPSARSLHLAADP